MLLRIRIVSDKLLEKIKTNFFWLITFFSWNRTIEEIMWENVVEQSRQITDDNILYIRNTAHAHCMLYNEG
jgi:hypothetical protein